MSEITGTLENWWVYYGSVVGDLVSDAKDRFPDGETVTTSALPGGTDNLKPGDIIQTRNSRYLLGKRSAACSSMAKK